VHVCSQSYNKSQSRGWVTREVLTEWFHESFEPSVETFLKKQNFRAKALIISDNAPGHPSEEQLKSRNGLIEVCSYHQSAYNEWIRMLYSL
jgi:hypothetical protein